jgi:hypothetical protein
MLKPDTALRGHASFFSWVLILLLLSHSAATSSADPSTSPAKAVVPDAAAQSSAEKIIRDIYKAEYARKKPAEREALAASLRKQAMETVGDPNALFVLLREARDIAASVGDFDAAFDAIDAMNRSFVLDANAMKLTVLKSASSGLNTPALQKRFISACLTFGRVAASGDNYDLAWRAVALADPVSRSERENSSAATVQARAAEYARLKVESMRVKAAEERLAANRANPEDYLAAGSSLCFTKAAWDRGLPLLAKSSDPTLKLLAMKEIAKPATPAAQRELADGWWAVAEKMKGAAATHIRSHAAAWYAKGLEGMSGLEKTRAEKRIALAEAEEKWGADEADKPHWISKTANYTLGSTDAKEGNHVPLPNLLDGTGGGYQDNEFAFHSAFEDQPFIIIDLGALNRVRRIEIVNRRNQLIERAATLAAWASAKPDGPWISIWQAEKAEKEWMIDLPGPVVARYIKIGLRGHDALHLFSVKVFGWEGS